MNEGLLKKIEIETENPRVAIIGSTSPNNKEYQRKMGIETGYVLRRFLEGRKGNLFTGGVSGVGADTYLGVTKWCQEKSRREDRFFVLIPEKVHITEPIEADVKYVVPRIYTLLANSIGKDLHQLVAGQGMWERRAYLAKIADVGIMINGGMGTLDEALSIIRAGKPVLARSDSGGTAKDLIDLKHGRLPETAINQLVELGILYLDEDLSLIHEIDSVREMTDRLEKLRYSISK